jgi:hypothetical protein
MPSAWPSVRAAAASDALGVMSPLSRPRPVFESMGNALKPVLVAATPPITPGLMCLPNRAMTWWFWLWLRPPEALRSRERPKTLSEAKVGDG